MIIFLLIIIICLLLTTCHVTVNDDNDGGGDYDDSLFEFKFNFVTHCWHSGYKANYGQAA